MKQNDNNTWLEEIRDGMLGFQADVPTDGWERVSSALPKNAGQMSVRRWWYAAASVLLCVCLGGAYLYFDNNSEDGIAENPTATSTKDVPSSKVNKELQSGETNNYPQQKAVRKIVTHKHLSDNKPSDTDKYVAESTAVVEEFGTEEVAIATEEKEIAVRDSVPRSRNHTTNDMAYHTVAQSVESVSHRHSWSFGINLGGHGSLLDVGLEGNSGMQNAAPDDGYWGVNPVPEADDVVESSNHASWSIGLSVAKALTPRLSLETGIAFTTLSSDVRLKHSGVQKQKIQYLGVPLRVNYRLGGLDSFQFYAGGGVMIERALSASRDGSHIDVNPWEFSTGLSFGGEYKATRNLSFYFEPGLNWYFSKNRDVPTLRSESPVYLNLKGGIRLSY